MSFLGKILEVNGIFITIVLLIFLVTGFPRERKTILVFLLVIMMIGWRIFSPVQSSRYYSFLIFVTLLFFSLYFKKKHNLLLPAAICLFYLFFQTYKLIHRPKDFYNSDIFQWVQREEKRTRPVFFSSSYFKQRLITLEDSTHLFFIDRFTDPTFFELFYSYYFFSDKLFFITRPKRDSFDNSYLFDEKRLKPEAHFVSKHTNMANIYSYSKGTPLSLSPDSSPHDVIHLFDGTNSHVLTSENILAKYGYFIKRGADFFTNKDLRLPEHDILINTWDELSPSNHPLISLENDASDPNKSRLHVVIRKKGAVYLFKKIPVSSGSLSFRITFSGGINTFYITHYDYIGNQLFPSKQIFLFKICDKEPHDICIPFDRSIFNGDMTMFLISGESLDFYLDNMSFITI